MKYRAAALFAAVTVIWIVVQPSSAWAFCDIALSNVRNVNFRGGDSYDMFETSEKAQTVYFRVRHYPSDGCSYFVTFSKGQAGSYDRAMNGPGPEDLRYQIYDGAAKNNVLKELPEATATEVLSGSFGTSNTTTEHEYFVALPAGQMITAGYYQDAVSVRLYEGTLSSHTHKDATSISIEARVLDSLQMCVVGCGSPFDPFAKSRTMAFGRMNPGDFRELDLLVRGNLDYEVMLRSQNRGVMKKTTSQGDVPYTLTFNGTVVDLSSGRISVVLGNAPTPTTGDRYTLAATIGNLDNAPPGSYQDNIDITVRSR